MPPSPNTQRKLAHPGKRARIGDRETGVWIVEKTGWLSIEKGHVYLLKGSRLRATWEFREAPPSLEPDWELAILSLDHIIAPSGNVSSSAPFLSTPPTRRQRLWWWFWPWAHPAARSNS